MYATAIVPAVLVVLGRLTITDSGHWLMARAARPRPKPRSRACSSASRRYPKEVRLADLPADEQAAAARVRRTAAGASSSRRPTGAPPSSPRCRGSCRISAPTASASSRRPSWPQTIGHEDVTAHNRQRPDRARHPGRQGRGAARHAADRRHPGRRAAGRSGRPHPPADHRLHRLRGRAGARGPVAAGGRARAHACCCSAASCCSTS